MAVLHGKKGLLYDKSDFYIVYLQCDHWSIFKTHIEITIIMKVRSDANFRSGLHSSEEQIKN